jgi:hypothetical protein
MADMADAQFGAGIERPRVLITGVLLHVYRTHAQVHSANSDRAWRVYCGKSSVVIM